MNMTINLKKIPAQLPGVLLLGAVSQIGQVLFMRELLMVFYGSELSIGIILAAWLVWVGVGSRLGARIIDRVQDPRRVLVFTSVGVALMIPGMIFLMRQGRAFFDVLPGAYLSLWDMTRTSFLLMAPVCALLGMQFVLLARVWREGDQSDHTAGAGKTYLTEALGNLLGGLAFTFLMVRVLSAMQSAVILAIVVPLAILPIIWKPSQDRKIHRWLLLGVLGLALLLLPFASDLDDWAYQRQWTHFSPQHQLIETHQSKHGTISVLQREGQYSFFQSGHLVFTTAGPEAIHPGMENIDAVQYAHFALVQHQDPQRILLVGGGLRGVLDEILQHPITHVDYIELDDVLTEVVQPYIPPATRDALADRRVRLMHTDGRLFVKGADRGYDLVMLDVPDPATAALNRYYTIEFFQEIKALLEPGGVFVIGAATTPDMRGLAVSNRNATVYHSLASVFSHVSAVSDQALLFLSTDDPEAVSLDPQVLMGRYRERAVQSEVFNPETFYTMLQDTYLRRVGWILRTHGRDPDAHREGPGAVPLILPDLAEQDQLAKALPAVNARYFFNSDLKPIGYFYTVMFLEHLTRAGGTETLAGLLNVEPGWVVIPLTLPVLFMVGLRIAARSTSVKKQRGASRTKRLAVLFSVFATGFSIMVLQICLIFAFQGVYGFVYEVIGVISALFMGGLAAGTLISNRLLRAKINLTSLVLIQSCIAIFALVMAVGLPMIIELQVLALIFISFSIMLLVAGTLNGLSFPISSGCLLAISQRADQSAGFVYSGELIGACVGAVLASVVMVPMWGMIMASLVAACANLSAVIVLLISRRF
jgi:spermidine synthase